MAQKTYHISFVASDGKLIEAEVEALYTPGEGFDEFNFDDVVVTDPATGESDFHNTHMPDEYLSEAEYEAEGKLPND